MKNIFNISRKKARKAITEKLLSFKKFEGHSIIKGEDTIVFSFSGAENNPKSMKRTLESIKGIDVIFLTEGNRKWYNKGFNNFNNTKKALKFIKLITLLYKNVFFIGGSMGGYGALLYASLLGRGKVLAFSPQTYLPGGSRSLMKNPPKKWKYPDLGTLKFNKIDISIIASSLINDVTSCINFLKAHPKAKITILDAPHNIAQHLRKKELLIDTVRDFLHCGKSVNIFLREDVSGLTYALNAEEKIKQFVFLYQSSGTEIKEIAPLAEYVEFFVTKFPTILLPIAETKFKAGNFEGALETIGLIPKNLIYFDYISLFTIEIASLLSLRKIKIEDIDGLYKKEMILYNFSASVILPHIMELLQQNTDLLIDIRVFLLKFEETANQLYHIGRMLYAKKKYKESYEYFLKFEEKMKDGWQKEQWVNKYKPALLNKIQ